MSKLIHFAIIGCGRIAQRHAEHINKLGKLTGVYDIVLSRAKELADTYKVPFYENLEDLLNLGEKPDVVSVCSPNGLHAEHSIRSLKAGYHVLCEKPMALTVQDCGQMINAAEQANKRLFIVKQNRFNPPVIAVKKIIEEGRLGKI